MKYPPLCTALLDVSKQVLMDGKALVELIHNPRGISGVSVDLDDIQNNISKSKNT
jgi:hypothetical protein